MRNSIVTLILSLIMITGFSQNTGFKYTGRYTPSIKKVKLNEANLIYEIMPEFSRYFVLPFDEYSKFEKQIITIYPGANFYPTENYGYLFNYSSVEISTTCNGKLLTSTGKSDTLTADQKMILNLADLGSDVHIKIKFRFKNEANHKHESTVKISEGEYTVTVVPQTEAEYPGGYKQFTDYLTENVINKIPGPQAAVKIQQAILKFTVDEQGHIVDARLARTTTDPEIDRLLLDATNKMPLWKPAKESDGLKVKQEFSIALGGGGC